MSRKQAISLTIVIIAVFIISGCKSSTTPTEAEITPTQNILPTNTVIKPTETSLPTATEISPTATATVELSPTPEDQIFRDDFSGPLSSLSNWKNEQTDRWTITNEGYLQIVGQNDILVTAGTQNNMYCVELPQGDFAASTHIVTSPNANFQQAAIFIYEDTNNFVTINRGYCDLSGCETGGNGFYMDYKVNGIWGGYRVATTATDVYLKLERVGSVLSGFYASKQDEWQRLGRFGDLFDLKEVCLGAGNGADVNSDLVAQFDYLDISIP